MSKIKHRKGLLLKSETIRSLSSDALDKVAGGASTTIITVPQTYVNCPTITVCPTVLGCPSFR